MLTIRILHFTNAFDEYWEPEKFTWWAIQVIKFLIKGKISIDEYWFVASIHEKPNWINVVDCRLEQPRDEFRLIKIKKSDKFHKQHLFFTALHINFPFYWLGMTVTFGKDSCFKPWLNIHPFNITIINFINFLMIKLWIYVSIHVFVLILIILSHQYAEKLFSWRIFNVLQYWCSFDSRLNKERVCEEFWIYSVY